jgi:NAD(P)-dependent dehydrogenase (short-subunit alcohol dehydrogenase family)
MKKNNYQGALQQPLQSGFGATTTATEVIKGIDLSGKTAIVTGGNTGLGLETTRVLAAAGARVIVPARDIEKARLNLQQIPNVEIEPMNLMDPASIDAFAQKFLESGRPLHLLINNAGIMWVPLKRDARGIESQLATNYLGQFQLVARLWPALEKANGARVVNVSSYGHQFAPIDFSDLNFEHREYKTLVAYGQSKTASNLFALELDERAKAFGVRAYSLHPGSIYGTELGRDASTELFKEMGYFAEDGTIRPEIIAGLKTVAQGAATTVWCATSPMLDLIGGVYCEDCDIAELDSGSKEQRNGLGSAGVQGYSLDAQSAKKLWAWSEQVTGIPFSI